MKLSIVTTLYQSSPYIEEFYSRIKKEAETITSEYEIIFVNDGSPDDSLTKAVSLYEQDKTHVKVIDLSRNFGHHKAIMTGLSHAQGDYVFLIDSDLEEEPEVLSIFWRKFHTDDIDVVYGVQERRKGGWFERWSGNLFYEFFNKLSHVTIPKNVVTVRLTSKRYNEALVAHKEQEIFLAGLWEITGFVQIPVVIHKKSHSKSTYSLASRITLLVNFLTSFSSFPLKAVLYSGFVISFLSMAFIFVIVIKRFFFNVPVEGWTSLIVSVWFLGGLMLFSIGMIGMYISKIFTETKQRPYTIVKKYYK